MYVVISLTQINEANLNKKTNCICSFGYFPGVKYPKEHTQYSNHGESLKSRKNQLIKHFKRPSTDHTTLNITT